MRSGGQSSAMEVPVELRAGRHMQITDTCTSKTVRRCVEAVDEFGRKIGLLARFYCKKTDSK